MNAFPREADESLPDVVEVRDPAHPLFGRRYCVLRRPMDGSGGLPPCYEVDYISGSTLMIPIKATAEYLYSENQTKLSIDSLLDLLIIAEGFEANDDRAERYLGVAIDDSAASSHRRGGVDHSGDLP